MSLGKKPVIFASLAYIVHNSKVLLVEHKKIGRWLPVGGHIDPGENPEMALFREIWEESGLKKVKIIGDKPIAKHDKGTFLFTPAFVDFFEHEKKKEYGKILGFIYILKAYSDKVVLNKNEHNDIKWFSVSDLDKKEYKIKPEVKFCALEALKKVKKYELKQNK